MIEYRNTLEVKRLALTILKLIKMKCLPDGLKCPRLLLP